MVAGSGTIDGRLIYVTSEDASVLAGTHGKVAEAKALRVRELAFEHRKPFVALMEAGAGRFQESSGAIAAAMGLRFRDHHKLSGAVPQSRRSWGPASAVLPSPLRNRISSPSSKGQASWVCPARPW